MKHFITPFIFFLFAIGAIQSQELPIDEIQKSSKHLVQITKNLISNLQDHGSFNDYKRPLKIVFTKENEGLGKEYEFKYLRQKEPFKFRTNGFSFNHFKLTLNGGLDKTKQGQIIEINEKVDALQDKMYYQNIWEGRYLFDKDGRIVSTPFVTQKEGDVLVIDFIVYLSNGSRLEFISGSTRMLDYQNVEYEENTKIKYKNKFYAYNNGIWDVN